MGWGEHGDSKRPVVGDQRSASHEQLLLAGRALKGGKVLANGLVLLLRGPFAQHAGARRLDLVDVVWHGSVRKRGWMSAAFLA